VFELLKIIISCCLLVVYFHLHVNSIDFNSHFISFQVKPSDPKYFSVELIEQAHGQSKYRVRFLSDLPLDKQFSVLIYSPETNQSVEVSTIPLSNI